MVKPISSQAPNAVADVQAFKEVLRSFTHLFELASRMNLTPEDVREVVQASARLKEKTLTIVRQTDDPSIQKLFFDARSKLGKIIGPALARNKFFN